MPAAPAEDLPRPPSPTDASGATAAHAAVDDLSYEQARDELVSVVARLEAGTETLEGSLQLWERGEALAARCQQWLDGARKRLEAAADAPTRTNRVAGPVADDDEQDER